MEQAAHNKRRKAVWTFSALIASLLLIQFVVRSYFSPSWFVFDWLPMTIYYGLFGLTCISIFFSALLNWGRETSYSLRVPALLIVVGATCAFLFNYLANRKENVPVIFQAYYDGDINGLGIRLRVDGTYLATDASVLGGDDLYGDYHLSADTIIIDREHFRFDDAHWRFSKRLIIRDDSVVFVDIPGIHGWSPEMLVIQDNRNVVTQH